MKSLEKYRHIEAGSPPTPLPRPKKPRKRTQDMAPHAAKRAIVGHQRRKILTQRILQLRVKGLSGRKISEKLVEEKLQAKIDHKEVHKLLIAALDEIQLPEADKLKRLELERLDEIISGHFEKAKGGDVGAVHAVLACVDRRNRLLGIGQEQKITSQTVGADGKPVDPVIRPIINLTIARRSD